MTGESHAVTNYHNISSCFGVVRMVFLAGVFRHVSEHEVLDHSLSHVVTELLYLCFHILQEGVAEPTSNHYNDADRDLI